MGLIPSITGLTTSTEIMIGIIAVVYALCTVVLQRKVANAKKLREIQAKVQKVSKEMNELVKKKAPESEIAAKQKEMMPLLSESMKSSIKPMFVILPIFLVVYYVLVPALPFSAGHVQSVQGLFFIVVFVVGFIAAMVMMVRDRSITKKEEAMLEASSASQEGEKKG